MAMNGKPGPSQSAFIAGGFGRYGRRGGGQRDIGRGRAMRAGRGRSSFGFADTGRLGGAPDGQGNTKKMLGCCHYCQCEGHWKAECLKRKADEAGNRFKNEGGHTAFVATTRMTKRKASDDWVIDSGASQHLSAQRERFINNEKISPLKIQIGD